MKKTGITKEGEGLINVHSKVYPYESTQQLATSL